MPNEKAEGLSREELRDKQYREWVNGPNFSQSSSKIWDGGYEAGWQAASLKQAEPPEEGHQCGDRWKPYPEVFCGGCIDGVPLSEVIAKHKQADPPSQPAIRLKELRDKFHANTLTGLVQKWRASARKSEDHLGDPDMDIENETHMRDMRMCADELEAKLMATTQPPPGMMLVNTDEYNALRECMIKAADDLAISQATKELWARRIADELIDACPKCLSSQKSCPHGMARVLALMTNEPSERHL